MNNLEARVTVLERQVALLLDMIEHQEVIDAIIFDALVKANSLFANLVPVGKCKEDCNACQ